MTMENTVLSERESTCRAAHEQVQLLQHLYERLPDERDERVLKVRRRTEELRGDRQLLVAKLKSLGLLRTEPDPERESLLEIAAGLKRAFSGEDGAVAAERLLSEEREFLRLSEQLAAQDDDQAIREIVERTQAAIERLEAA